jgi:hypothetical protein
MNTQHAPTPAGGSTGQPRHGKAAALRAAAIFVAVFIVYNANGREISSWDSQGAKFAAVEFGRYHTFILDSVVLRTPQLMSRPSVAIDRDGHYRSTYPMLPMALAGSLAFILRHLRLIDLSAPLAGSLVAKLTASLLTALAVSLAFLIARRRVPDRQAAVIALGFGLGTNLWATASQTLWQTETAVAALSGAVLCLAVPAAAVTSAGLWSGALLLGFAGAARPQLAPAIAVLVAWLASRRRRAGDLAALIPLLTIAGGVMALNIRWFGHVLGAIPAFEALHPAVHAVAGTWGNPIVGAAGLVASPSRGLLVFSPVVLVVLAALPAIRRERWHGELWWLGLAALVQFAFYATYSVWWGGHTYGPRYMLDILPLLVPLAAAGLPWVLQRRWRRALGLAALLWSVTLAGTGAFVYPHDQWNIVPDNVDQNHDRLWDLRDPQFVRCWTSGWNPSNFMLFSESVRHR